MPSIRLILLLAFAGCMLSRSAEIVADPPRQLPDAQATRHEQALDAALLEGLRDSLTFDRHLLTLGGGSTSGTARFDRGSLASLPDLTLVPRNHPRYVPGKFGEAIFIEHGRAASTPQSSQNLLPADVAALDDLAVSASGGKVDSFAGLQGQALRLVGSQAGATVAIPGVAVGLEAPHVWSIYLRGSIGQAVQLRVETIVPAAADEIEDLLADTDGAPKPRPVIVAESNVELGEGWQRIELPFHLRKHPEPILITDPDATSQSYPLQLVVTLPKPGTLLLDAMMLEAHDGYAGRQSASTWIPGGHSRAGEILHLDSARAGRPGTIAFWVKLQGSVAWRNLMTIGAGHGWSEPMRIDVRQDKLLQLVLLNSQTKQASKPLTVGQWHHVAVRWQDDAVSLFVDGQESATMSGVPPAPIAGRIVIGGVATNFSPAVRADGAFDDVMVWERALTNDEVASLAARAESAAAAVPNELTIADLEPISSFARDDRERHWHLDLTNRSGAPLTQVKVELHLDDLLLLRGNLPESLPDGSVVSVRLPWSPARLLTGDYQARIVIESGERRAVIERQITILPPRRPFSTTQVISWSGISPSLNEVGVTSTGVMGLDPQPIEQIVRQGMYVTSHLRMEGHVADEAARFHDLGGQPAQIDQRDPAALADLDTKLDEAIDKLELMPDVRFLILNSEHQWIHTPDFRPATMEAVRERFGLDLNRWRALELPPDKHFTVLHPMGRLSPRGVGIEPPADGILPLDDPFLAFHRWWHYEAGTEVFLNETMARRLHEELPHVRTIVEPSLRRPSVKPFVEQDYLEEWFYYPEPTVAVMVQERLAAQTRGTRALYNSMPQFLFKPNMAAPYGGMPTPHLFRETVWHCLARPMQHMLYWNLLGAIEKGDKNTQEEIDAELGPTPDWRTARAGIKVDGEKSSLFLFIPELKDEVARLHNEVVRPLAGLLPVWRNRPRQIAVYMSFAGELFSEIRWTYRSPLSGAIRQLTLPYDVLFDDDFTGQDDLLANYRVLLIPESAVITEPAAGAIRRWQQAGGILIVDGVFPASWPDARRLEHVDAASRREKITARDQELVALYGNRTHPLYLEGMEQYAEELAAELTPDQTWLREQIASAVDTEVKVDSSSVYLNTLQAEGANYVVAVNDLRRPGRHYGHFSRVLEDGIAQEIQLDLHRQLGGTVYDLLSHRQLPVEAAGEFLRLRHQLQAAGGALFMMLPRPIANLELRVETSESEVTLIARLTDAGGALIPGIVPLELTIHDADGQVLDFSHVAALRHGEYRFARPIAYNEKAISCTATVRELASGQTATASWQAKALTPTP